MGYPRIEVALWDEICLVEEEDGELAALEERLLERHRAACHRIARVQHNQHHVRVGQHVVHRREGCLAPPKLAALLSRHASRCLRGGLRLTLLLALELLGLASQLRRLARRFSLLLLLLQQLLLEWPRVWDSRVFPGKLARVALHLPARLALVLAHFLLDLVLVMQRLWEPVKGGMINTSGREKDARGPVWQTVLVDGLRRCYARTWRLLLRRLRTLLALTMANGWS